jgi:hypothetical protein
MNEIALQCLRQAVKAYREGEGASVQGAFRDCVTDLLHLAHKNRSFKDIDDDNLYDRLCSEGYNMYLEERETAEYHKVSKIPDKKLPLHSISEFEFDSAKKLFEKRLKGDPSWQEKLSVRYADRT